MSPTIYVPDSEDLANLLADLSKFYPDRIQTKEALEVVTDVPQVIDLLQALGPSTLPKKELKKVRRGPYKPRGGPSNPSGLAPAGDEPIVHDDQTAWEESQARSAAPQVFNWRLLATGKECNSISTMMRYRKLQPGDRVMHKTLGLHEILERGDGSLYAHRVAS